jgi:rhamnosyltransferase
MTASKEWSTTDALNPDSSAGIPSITSLNEPGESIMGILVTYNTDPSAFIELLDRFSTTIPLVVCDNSTDRDIRTRIKGCSDSRNMVYLPMNGNVGIAAAQNRGIEFAKSQNASFVLLIDDDSHLTAAEALQLREAYRQLSASGKKVGAVSARAISAKGQNLSNVPDPGRPGFTRCPLLNSSGTLIALETFTEVGLMNEELFIDLVDFDWGWRALGKGYGLFITEGVRFQHALGVGALQVFGLRGGIPNPIRHYYQTRNTLYLLAQPHVPINWKLRQIINLAIKIVVFPIFITPRLERLAHFSRGTLDALTGTMGPKR